MPTSHYVVIDNEFFPLAEGDEAEVKERIVDAVHAGGDFVALRRDADRRVDVLITPSSSVTIEHIEERDAPTPENQTEAAAAHRLMLDDVEWWLESSM